MTSSNPASGDLVQELEKVDIDLITDEDHLRKLWQSTEDFAEKRRIRTRMYKLREQRLKEFYTSNDVVESPNKKTMSSSSKMEVEYAYSSVDGDTDTQKRRNLDEHDTISEKIRRKDEERTQRYHNLMNEMETATTASGSGQAMFSTMSHLESSSHTFVTLDSTRAEDLGYDSMQMESGAMSIVTGNSVTDGNNPTTVTQLEENGDAATVHRANAEKSLAKTTKARRISTEKDSPTRKLSFESKKVSPTRKKSDARKNSCGGIPSEEVKSSSTVSPSCRKSKDSTTPTSRKKSTERKSVTEKLDTNEVVMTTSSRPVQITYREEQRQTSRRETTDGKTTTVVETTEFIRYPEPTTAQTSQPRTKERVTISKTAIIDSSGTVLDENEDENVEELPYDSPVANLSLQALLSRPSANDEYREESRRVSQRETSDGKTRTEIEVVETIRRYLKRNELEKVTQTKTTVYDTNGTILDTHEDEAIEVLEETTNSPAVPTRSDASPVTKLDQLASPDIATRINLLLKPLVCVLSSTSDYVEERRRVSRQKTDGIQGQTHIEVTEESIRYHKNPSVQPRRVKVIIKRITVLNQEGSIVDEKEEETSESLPDLAEDSQTEVVTLKSKPARKTSKKVTRGRKTSDIRPLTTTTDGDFLEEEREVTRRETSDGKLTKVVLVTIIIRRAKDSPKRERLTVTKTTILDSKGEVVEEDESSHTEEVKDEPAEEPVVAAKQPFKVGPKGDLDDGCRKHRQNPDSEAKIAPVAHVPLNATAVTSNIEDDIIPNVEETVTPKKAFKVCDTLEPTPSIDDGLLEPPGRGKSDETEEPTTAKRPGRPSGVEISELDLDDSVIPDGSVERRYSVITPEPMRSPDIPCGPPRMEIEEVKPEIPQEEEDEHDVDDDPKKKKSSVESPVKQAKKKTDSLSEPKKPGSRIPTTKEPTNSAPRRGNTSELKPKTGAKDAETNKPVSKSQIPAPKTKSPTKDADSTDSPLLRTRGVPSDPTDTRNLSPQRKPKDTIDEPKKRTPNTAKPVRPDNLEINGVPQASPQQKTPLSSPDRSSPLKNRKPLSDKDGRSDSPQRRCCGRHSGEVPKVNSSVTATSPTRSKIPRSETPLKKPQQDLTEYPALKHVDADRDRPESPSRSKLRYSSPVPKVAEPSTPTKTTRSLPQGTSASPKKPATPSASSSGIPTRTDSPKPAKGVPSSVIANLPEELRNRPVMTKTVEYTKVYRVRDDDKPWRVNSKPAEPKKDLHQSVMQVVEKYVDCENCEIHGHKKHKEPERVKKDDSSKSPSTPRVASPEKFRRDNKRETPAARDASPLKQPEFDDDVDEPSEAYRQPDDDAEFNQPKRAASPESIDEDYIAKRQNEPFSIPSMGPSTTNTDPERAAELDRDAPSEPKDKFRPVQPSDDEEDSEPRGRSRSPPKSLQPESFTTLPTPSSPTKDIDARQALTASPALDSPSAVIKAIKSTLNSPTSPRKSPEKDSPLPARPKAKSPEKEDTPSVVKPSQISQIRHGYENRKDDAPVRPVRKSSLKKTTEEPSKINRIRNTFEKPESTSSTPKEPKESTTRRTPLQANKKPSTEEAPTTPTAVPPATKAPTESGNLVIEEIEDVPLLEQMLDTATNYDDRSRIRAQIRIVKKKQGATPSKTPGSSSPMLGRRTMPAMSETPNQRKSLSKPSDLEHPEDDSGILEPQPASLAHEPDREDQVPSRKTSATREPMSTVRKPSTERKTSSPTKSPSKESKPFIPSETKAPSVEPEHPIQKPVQELPDTTEQKEVPRQREEVPWRRSPERERPRQSPVKDIPLRETAPTEQVAPWRRSPEKEMQPTRQSPAKEAPPKPAEETTVPWRKTSASQLPGTPDQERPSSSRPALTPQLSQSKLRTPTHLPEDDFSQPPADLQDITSSYGTGPTDENGLPLFGLGALRRKPKTSDTKSPADLTSTLPQEGLKEPKESKDHGPTDSSGRPLFGLRAIVAKPDNEGVPRGPEEDTIVPVIPRSPNLHAIIRKHEDAADKPEPPKSPALKPKSKLRDSFIRPVEDEAEDRPLSPLPDKTIADRSQPLKQIIQKHQQAVETATITRTSVIDEEKSIHDRSQPLRDIIQRHETLSSHVEPTPQVTSPAPVTKRPGILKKPKEAGSPQETPSPTKENVEFLPSELSPSKPATLWDPSPVKETETRPRAPTEQPNRRDSNVDQPQPVVEPREPEEVRRTSVSYFSSTTTTSVRRSVTPERNVYTTSTVLPSPAAPLQPSVPTHDISAPATTESPRTRGIPIEGRPYRGSVKETPKWPPTKETKEPVQALRRPSAPSSGADQPTRPWSTSSTNAPQPQPTEEPQPERRPSQVSYIEIPLSRPAPEPVTKRPSQPELVPEPVRAPQEPLQQFKPLTSATILRGKFESPTPQDTTPQPEKPTSTPTSSAPWRNRQSTPESDRRPMPSTTVPSATAPWRRPREEPAPDSSQPRTPKAGALQPKLDSDPFSSTITLPLRRPSEPAGEFPERRPSQSVTQTSYMSSSTIVASTTFRSPRASVSPDRHVPSDSNPPRRISNAFPETVPTEPQERFTSSTTLPQRKSSDTSSSSPLRKPSQVSEVHNISLTGETTGHTVKSVSTFQLQLGNLSVPPAVQVPGLATQPDSSSATPTASWRKQSQEQRTPQYPQEAKPAISPYVVNRPEESPSQFKPTMAAPPTTTSTPSSSRKPSIDATPSPSSATRTNIRTGASGSIRALAQKFLENGDSSTPKAAYPRAGLIFRSSSFRQGQQPDSDGQGLQRSASLRIRTPDRRSQDRESQEKTPSYLQSTSLEVNIGTPNNTSLSRRTTLEPANEQVEQSFNETRKTSVTSVTLTPIQPSTNSSSPYTRSPHARSFLEDHTPVSGINDIMDRMRAAEPTQPGDQDAEARSLLNKFLGAQVIVQSMDPWAKQNLGATPLTESIISTSVNVSDDGKSVSRTVAAAQKGGSSTSSSGVDSQGRQWTSSSATSAATFKSHTITQAMGEPCIVGGIDVNSCDDDFKLNELLDNCDDYETRRKIRARIKQVLAEQQGEGFSPSVAEGDNVTRRTSNSVTSQNEVLTQRSSFSSSSFRSTSKGPGNSAFAKFQQLDQSAAKTPRLGQLARFSSVTSSTSGTHVVRSASDVKDMLLKWCQARTRGYQNVAIENFSSSWSSGLAFCALIHHFYPDAFDYTQLKPENRRQNFELAFRVAEEKAGIAPLLDVEDMVFMARPDWKCVFTYVQSIYRRLKDE